MILLCVAETDAKLRPYLPNVDFQAATVQGGGDQPIDISPTDVGMSLGHGLAIVATRDVKDEEVLLNYRWATFCFAC